MPAPRLFIQWRSRLIERIVTQQFLQQRYLIQPFVLRHVVRLRFRRRDARRIRLVCTCVHLAFFRRRLTTDDIRKMP